MLRCPRFPSTLFAVALASLPFEAIQAQRFTTVEQCELAYRLAMREAVEAGKAYGKCMDTQPAMIGEGLFCGTDHRLRSTMSAWYQCQIRHMPIICSAEQQKADIYEQCAELRSKKAKDDTLSEKAKKAMESVDDLQTRTRIAPGFLQQALQNSLAEQARRIGVKMTTALGGKALGVLESRELSKFIKSWDPKAPGLMSEYDRHLLSEQYRFARAFLRGSQSPGITAIQDLLRAALLEHVTNIDKALAIAMSEINNFDVEYAKSAPAAVAPTPPSNPAPATQPSTPPATAAKAPERKGTFDECSRVYNRFVSQRDGDPDVIAAKCGWFVERMGVGDPDRDDILRRVR